jgi:hypothetical protein
MTSLAGHAFVNARRHGLLDLNMAILAYRLALDMAHTADALMTVNALDLLRNMNIFRKARGLGELFSEVAVSPPPFHGPRMAHERAPASARAVCGRRRLAERMTAALPRGRVVAVETSGVTDIARLLLGNRLL